MVDFLQMLVELPERILAKTLNRGKGICWCAVRRDKERFNYSLSPGKRIRLAVESVLK